MRILSLLLCIQLGLLVPLAGQSWEKPLSAKYDQYKEAVIEHRRFRHDEIVPLIKALEEDARFEINLLGKSVEEREIYGIRIGQGPTRVLLWSQMHGNEATATMAIMDLFNFLQESDDFDHLRDLIFENLTLYFIPLLNPDGAQQFQRRNAYDIDLNRDALRTVTPEGTILKETVMQWKPHFGFNLHDQSIYYTVGYTSNPATFSFLAPAYNYEKEVNEVRGNAMKMISVLNRFVQQNLPGHVAKYNDDFEPRAFGDNIQKWGTSTILIESGGLKDDVEKQQMRKLHFLMLLTAFEHIATKKYTSETIEDYYAIPENERLLFDLLIRNATLEHKGNSVAIDIGFRHDERELIKQQSHYRESSINDLGDLSIFHGYQEIDASGMRIIPGNVYPQKLASAESLSSLDLHDLVNRGFTNFMVENWAPRNWMNDLPVHLQTNNRAGNNIRIGANPAFLLVKDKDVKYVIANGKAFELNELKGKSWPPKRKKP